MSVIIPAAQNHLAESRPFARRQFESTREQWIATAISLEIEACQVERRENIFGEVGNCRFSVQFSAQNLVENLEMTWAILERRSRRCDHWQLNCDSVSIADRLAVQMR